MTQVRQICRWHLLSDAAALEQTIAAEILRAANHAITQRGAFHVALSGGNTPRRIHEAIRTGATDWSRWHVWFGDERCLPPDDPERNSRMAADTLLDHVGIPPGQCHPIRAELGATVAAADYVQQLRGIGEFDLMLLGLGEDGHTASLFPGHDWGVGADAPDALAVFDSPKPPPERVSLSARRLAKARQVIYMVSGAGKRQALADWQAGKSIPASAVAPAGGVDVYVA